MDYSHIFDKIDVGIAFLFYDEKADDFIVKDINPAGLNIIKKSSFDDIKHSRIKDNYPIIHKLGLWEVFKQVISTGESCIFPLKDNKNNVLNTWLDIHIFKNGDNLLIVTFRDITIEKRLFMDIKQKENLFKDLVETTSDWIWQIDNEGYFTYVSPRVKDLLGYEPEELIGKSAFDIMSPEEAERVKKIYQYHVDMKEPLIQMENINIHKSGIPVTLESSGIPLLDTEGNLLGYRGIDRDISRRKTAEEDRDNFFNGSIDMMCIAGHDGFFKQLNPAWTKTLGWKIEDMMDKPWLDFVHPDDHELTKEAAQLLIARRPIIDFENRYLCKNGKYKWLSWNAFANPENGKIYAVARDISEKREIEHQMELSNKIFENSIEGICVTNTKGIIQMINPAFTAITQYEEHECIGRNPRILKSNRHNHEFYENMWIDLRIKGNWEGEIWNRRKNGEIYPEWLSITAIRNKKNKTTHYVALFHDISALKQGEEKLKYQAYYDPLTDLPNRILFNERLKKSLEEAKEKKIKHAVICLDIDNFKNINDSLGHHIGDDLLVAAAGRLKRFKEDIGEDKITVARYSGDEFVISVSDISKKSSLPEITHAVVERFSHPFHMEQHEFFITVSLGISIFPEDGVDTATLIKNADTAMHLAKNKGKNQFQFYTSELNMAILKRLAIEKQLRKALFNKEFFLTYQPKVDIKKGKVVSAETLIRWINSDLGFVSPLDFIPLAEETGMINEIGDWVFEQVCCDLKDFLEKIDPDLVININLSAVQFNNPHFLDNFLAILKKYDLSPRHICIELTESTVIKDVESALDTMKKIRSAGMRLSIDDFGTGYSSLSYLTRFPLNELKIDKSFINNITKVQEDKVLAKSIILMGHNLNFRIVAEGVETQEQFEMLKEMECDEIQGYLFSPPQKKDDIIAFNLKPFSEILEPCE